jgi:hypothetical protein
MADRHLPVLVWNNRVGQWEPVDFRLGQLVVVWPDVFYVARLPLPDYRDGDRVQFVRDEAWCGWFSCGVASTVHWPASRSSSSSSIAIERAWFIS